MSAYRERGVFVTGGAGVIGRDLIESLVAGGARVLWCDLKPRPQWLDADGGYIEGDANELRAEQVRAIEPEYCFHLAAKFERTVETPGFWAESHHHNVALSHHVASLALKAPSLRRSVFASSYLVYDPALYLSDAAPGAPTPLPETAPLYPRNLCGSAKLMHEQELAFLAQFAGTPFTSVCARIFRAYGRSSSEVVSRWVRSLIADGGEPLPAFRTEGLFDDVYSGDVAAGLLRLGSGDAVGEVNLGTGRSRRVAELLEILAERFPGTTWTDEPADIAFEGHQADMSRFESITGWRPPTSLEEGVGILAGHELAAVRA